MRHGEEVCRLLVVVVTAQTQKKLILKKGIYMSMKKVWLASAIASNIPTVRGESRFKDFGPTLL